METITFGLEQKVPRLGNRICKGIASTQWCAKKRQQLLFFDPIRCSQVPTYTVQPNVQTIPVCVQLWTSAMSLSMTSDWAGIVLMRRGPLAQVHLCPIGFWCFYTGTTRPAILTYVYCHHKRLRNCVRDVGLLWMLHCIISCFHEVVDASFPVFLFARWPGLEYPCS